VILECAERPVRDIITGGMGKVLSLANLAPRLTDWYMQRSTFEAQKTAQRVAEGRRDNLYAPLEHDGGERGRNWQGRTKGTSLYTKAALHPRAAAGTAVGLGLALVVAGRALRRAYRHTAPRPAD
jgi:hypothetical protein